MGKKIYLSPALHGSDNATKCPVTCSENTHCGQYMDIVERRLKALGFEVRRGGPATGTAAMYARVKESNAWGADIHYCAHTNAGGGRYSMTMCYNNKTSREMANVIHKYRKTMPHKVRTSASLYEINATKAVCLYDELIFHDNADDCAWFHNGGMQQQAEETVKAFCEMCDVSYTPEKEELPQAEVSAVSAGMKVKLTLCPLYISASAKNRSALKTGTYYLWDGIAVSGRYRITNSLANCRKAGQVTGWIDAKYVK